MKRQKPLEFIKSCYLWSAFKDRVLPHLKNGMSSALLSEYVLPKDMQDSEIQKQTKSNPIPVEIFASVLQNFCKTADKSKCYIFHVQTPKEVVAVRVLWSGDEWDLDALDFDDDNPWFLGDVFLFSATGTSETDNKTLEPLDSLTLEKAVTIIKNAGYVIIKPSL